MRNCQEVGGEKQVGICHSRESKTNDVIRTQWGGEKDRKKENNIVKYRHTQVT